MLKTAILVCKQSKIRLKHTKSYRAITEKEFLRFMEYDTSINLGIIEIDKDATDEVIGSIIKLVDYCESNLNKRVILMSYKSDVSMDYVAYSVTELQELIEAETGYDVSTYIKESLFDEQQEVQVSQVENDLSSIAEFEIPDEEEEEEENIEVIKIIKDIEEHNIENEKIKDLEMIIDDLKEKLDKSVSVNAELESTRENLLKSKNKADNEIVRLTSELESNKHKIAELESNNYAGEIERLVKELDSYKIKVSALDEIEDKLKEINSLCDEKDKTIKDLENSIKDIEKKDRRNEIVLELNSKRADTIRFIDKIYVDLKNTINVLKTKDSELHEALREVRELTDDCNSLKESLNSAISREKDYTNKEAKYKENISLLESNLDKLGEEYNNSNRLLETYKSKVLSAEASIAQSDVIKTKLSITEKELKARIAEIADKDIEIKRLNSSVNTKEVITVGVDKVFSSFEYKGTAKLINLFGGGSYGITNIAYSIANKLKGKVLFLDFDLFNPKSDRYTKKNPMVSVAGVPNNLYRTGVGVLYSCGIDKFISEYDKLVIKVLKIKELELSWISGLYSVLKLENLDYTSEFFNYVGSLYDYIIIDSGKLGYSNINDSLIKSLCEISYKNLVVSSNDTVSIRGIGLALNKVKLANVDWILNLSNNSIISDKAKKSIGDSSYYILPFSNSIFGTDKLIIDDNNIDGRLSAYLSKFGLEVNKGGL